MTPQRARCLSAITAYVEANGFSPTLDEIAAQLGCKRSNVWRHVVKLEREGRVRRRPRHDRTLEPILPNGATPSVMAAAWEAVDAWRAGRPMAAEMADLLKALDPERFG